MAKNYELENSGKVNIIAEGTTFTGDIVTSGDCRIDGTIHGNINSSAKIFIGKNGQLVGDVKCNAMDIEGVVKANVETSDILSIKATATMEGNVLVNKIAIEPGARFSGTCKMHATKPNAKPNTQV